MSFTITPAVSPADLTSINILFSAYATALGLDLSFQDFTTELASLPGKYAPPTGALLLAKPTTTTTTSTNSSSSSSSSAAAFGCVGLRHLKSNDGVQTCEMKRLYVSPMGRGTGVGKALAQAIVVEAKRLGYQRMRLDTLASMTTPLKMYRAMGFKDIEAYYDNPLDGVIYLELELN